MTTKIELRRMTFYAYHGVAPQETRVGNTFIVDLILTAPFETSRARGGAYLEGFEREISTDHGGGTCLV